MELDTMDRKIDDTYELSRYQQSPKTVVCKLSMIALVINCVSKAVQTVVLMSTILSKLQNSFFKTSGEVQLLPWALLQNKNFCQAWNNLETSIMLQRFNIMTSKCFTENSKQQRMQFSKFTTLFLFLLLNFLLLWFQFSEVYCFILDHCI